MASKPTFETFTYYSFIIIIMAVLKGSADSFEEEVIKSDTPVFVDFYADWCGPCKMTSPIIDELSEDDKYKDIKFIKVNVDENQELAGKYSVFSIPTFISFSGGDIVSQFSGARDKAGFESELEKLVE